MKSPTAATALANRLVGAIYTTLVGIAVGVLLTGLALPFVVGDRVNDAAVSAGPSTSPSRESSGIGSSGGSSRHQTWCRTGAIRASTTISSRPSSGRVRRSATCRSANY